MNPFKAVVIIPLLVTTGCAHVDNQVFEDSATASVVQITEHLKSQINCTDLSLKEEEQNRFTGTGTKDSSAFTIIVTREGGTLRYQGQFTNPAQGNFGGTSSWSHTKTVSYKIGLGHRQNTSSETSTSSDSYIK